MTPEQMADLGLAELFTELSERDPERFSRSPFLPHMGRVFPRPDRLNVNLSTPGRLDRAAITGAVLEGCTARGWAVITETSVMGVIVTVYHRWKREQASGPESAEPYMLAYLMAIMDEEAGS